MIVGKNLPAAAALLLTLVASTCWAQGVPNPAHPFAIYDLTMDGNINNEDVNQFQYDLMELNGPLGRSGFYRVDNQNRHLDVNHDLSVDLRDVMLILHYFGHFSSTGEFIASPGGGCQIGDLNADGVVGIDDMEAFVNGRRFWQWWNNWFSVFGSKAAIYTFGDLDMDGDIDLTDFLYLQLLWTEGEFEGEFPDDYTSSIRPDGVPIGVWTWICE
ncbi:MAG: hypothetical protein AAFN77_03360 [Planctomycetota bacterium]